MGLESVGDLAINVILKKLGAQDIARVACVSKRFSSSASDDTLWINLCFNELALTQPLDHLGNPLSSFKVGTSSVFGFQLGGKNKIKTLFVIGWFLFRVNK